MLKYNDDNIFVGYIKQLLHTFNLPKCQINFKKEFEGNKRSLHYIKDNSLYFYDINTKESRRVRPYKLDDKVENITQRLEIRNNIYDTYTHEYLGNYLRYIRDYTGVDLMCMYNCFSNAVMSNTDISIKDSKNIVHEFNSSSSSYTLFAVPVKWNKKYTIAIDWHGSIEMFSGLYQNGNRVPSSTFGTAIGNDDFNQATFRKYSGMRFNHPVVYDALDFLKLEDTGLQPDFSKESCLKLIIKIPNECKSSIVILEGDYTKDTEMYINEKHLQVMGNKQVLYRPELTVKGTDSRVLVDDIYDSNTSSTEYQYITKHQLLFVNTGEHFLLADRLMEYLCGNAINPNDEVIANIAQLQRKIYYDGGDINKDDKIPFKVEHFGFWQNNIREFLYRLIQAKGINNNYFDLIGYLDKDMESKIGDFDTINNKPKKEEDNKWQPTL